MLSCFTEREIDATPIYFFMPNEYMVWQNSQAQFIKNWLCGTHFLAEPGRFQSIPDESGNLSLVICCIENLEILWNAGSLPMGLPVGTYYFANAEAFHFQYAIAWGLGAYQFSRYKKQNRLAATLYVPKSVSLPGVLTVVESLYLVRDLINTPADDLGPTQFADFSKKLAAEFSADYKEVIGEDLLAQNFASIYTVGRASDDLPRLIELRWGKANHPKVTLVGKGVCFDSGGLDLKPSAHMALMKKDMGGGAHVLGLARMIMQAKLPVHLRVLIPVVENVVSGNAYRPGDIIKSRKGLTIEIGNTDAEGRVVLADALTEACSENPALLIDISTLTGAARIALGPDLPVMFANNQELANALIQYGVKENDPMWQLPLYAPYREYITSSIADLNNNSSEPYGGAITAALFLKEFVPEHVPWVHFDLMAWNTRPKPGRPQGGEAMGIRALFAYLREQFTG